MHTFVSNVITIILQLNQQQIIVNSFLFSQFYKNEIGMGKKSNKTLETYCFKTFSHFGELTSH